MKHEKGKCESFQRHERPPKIIWMISQSADGFQRDWNPIAMTYVANRHQVFEPADYFIDFGLAIRNSYAAIFELFHYLRQREQKIIYEFAWCVCRPDKLPY